MNANQIINHLTSGTLTRSDAETFAATIKGKALTEVCQALRVPTAGTVRDRQEWLVIVAMRKRVSEALRNI